MFRPGLALLLVLTLAAAIACRHAQAKPPQAAPATAAALPPPKLDVKNWTLANGLKVLFLADHKAPIATVQVFYHVGSKDEHVGIRGIAHMFEHMMFKGSDARAARGARAPAQGGRRPGQRLHAPRT